MLPDTYAPRRSAFYTVWANAIHPNIPLDSELPHIQLAMVMLTRALSFEEERDVESFLKPSFVYQNSYYSLIVSVTMTQ